jgi:hypothetical protein
MVGSAAFDVVRAVGPTAFAVLVDLFAHADREDDALIADGAVRHVAGRLGVSKDTAARALDTLRAHRLVVPLPRQRFTAGRFRLNVDPDAVRVGGIDVDLAAPSEPRQSRHRERDRGCVATDAPAQLGLFPAPPSGR